MRLPSPLRPSLPLGVAVLALSACGGGGPPGAGGTTAAPAGAALPTLLLAEPRQVGRDSRIAYAWASDGFAGSLFARIEFGFSFAPGEGWTLQHNGPPAVYDEGDGATYTLSYRDGFFLMTALADSSSDIGSGYGLDLYPGDVTPISPAFDCSFSDPCTNSLAFFPWFEFPRTAGTSISLPIPRPDPANLRYDVEVQRAAGRGFAPVAQAVQGQVTVAARGTAWQFDFPTAAARVRGCSADGRCVTSQTQPLARALLDGIARLPPTGPAANAELAVSGDGRTLVTFGGTRQGTAALGTVSVFAQGSDRRWQPELGIDTSDQGLRRGFALSHDGGVLAVEFGRCGDAAAVCADSAVVVYVRSGARWAAAGRFAGLARPRLSGDGQRLAGVRAGGAVVFVHGTAGWQEQPVAAGGAPARDVELSSDGATLAVAHGSAQAACGCREVSLHAGGAAGWRETGRVRAAVPGGPEGSAEDDGFGAGTAGARSLALDARGTLLAVGAPGDEAGGRTDAGAVHLFRAAAPGGAWRPDGVLRAHGAAAGDRAGQRVALSADGTRLMAGARGLAAHAPGVWRNHAADAALPGTRPDGTPAGGAAYVFVYGADCVWAQRSAVLAPTSGEADFLRHFALATDAEGSSVVLATGRPAGDAAGDDPARAVFTY